MHSIAIDKYYDIDLKLYAITLKVGKYIARTFF
jgi:hypothetical protein